jgi:hypothetical protein
MGGTGRVAAEAEARTASQGEERRALVEYRSGRGEFVETTLDLVATPDLIEGMPVREFRVYKGRRHYSGWYFSTTMNRFVVYESRLELARILLADFNPRVVGIAAQPLRLVGADGGRVRRHVPDLLLVDRDGGVLVVDVKAPERVAQENNQRVFAWTRRIVATRGWGFEVWAREDATVLANVRFLANYRLPSRMDASLVPDVLARVAEGTTMMAVEQAMSATPKALVRPVVLHLVWTGQLATDLSAPLGLLSPITPVDGVGQ